MPNCLMCVPGVLRGHVTARFFTIKENHNNNRAYFKHNVLIGIEVIEFLLLLHKLSGGSHELHLTEEGLRKYICIAQYKVH